eukprot:9039261-Pyramimonas_sp.AAC.1
MKSSDSGMGDDGSSTDSKTESRRRLLYIDAKNQRRQERTQDVGKDARNLKKDSKRSTRALAGANRLNGPTVPREGNGREDAHSGGASVQTAGRQPTTADATEWQTVEPKHKRKKGDNDKGGTWIAEWLFGSML